jgi:hypothetical protein
MAWATSIGLTTTKRPSRLLGQVRAEMIAALQSGGEKSEVATLGAMSIESVTRLLRTEVGLREAWAQARRTKAQAAARSEWLSTIADNRDLGVKAVRMLAPAAYAWLYRNDRDWLDQQAMLLSRPRAVLAPRVDWDQRDQHLAQAVRVTALELSATAPAGRITLAALCSLLPELRAKIRKLSRLPQTERVINELVKRRTSARSKSDPALL